MTFFKKTLIALTVAVSIAVTGCTSLHIFGKNAAKEQKQADKVEQVQNQLGANLQTQMTELANLHYGVDYALSKENAPSKNVEVAKDLNQKALSISGTPTVEEMTKMKQMIDDLTSQLATERAEGAKALGELNQQLGAVQQEKKDLLASKDAEIAKYMKFAQDAALKADDNAAKLSEMNKWLGLGAVWYGLKHFVIRMAWILGIGSVLYLILRLAAASNPIAASVFGIFETVVSWAIQAVKVIAPKAISIAGHTATTVTNTYRDLLVKMVDGIETLREQEKAQTAQGVTPKQYTLTQLLDTLSKMMDGSEKQMIQKIKTDIGYTG
jgi:hypothetical protein